MTSHEGNPAGGEEPPADGPGAGEYLEGPSEVEPDAPEDEEAAELSAKERLAAERDEYLDSLKRLQADFDNYRKRSMRQQTELLERATEGLIVQLLPVLDALDLSEGHSEADSSDALAQIASLLRGTLGRQGLERIDEAGVAFDPTVHDAVAHEEPDEGSSGRHEISEVMRAGYTLKGRVLRPAMVKVKG